MKHPRPLAVAACLLLKFSAWAQQPGTITTVAGNGNGPSTGDGGPATSAAISLPSAPAFDPAGNMYIADASPNCRIRKVDASGIITTFAGNGSCGYSGDGGLAVNAGLNPVGVAVDAAGNVLIIDGQRIRKVDRGSRVISTVAGNGTFGYQGDGGPASNAEFKSPEAVVTNAAGDLFIADLMNQRIRRVDHLSGAITTIAGNGVGAFSGDNGPAASASLWNPIALAFDSAENLYVCDQNNNRIRRIDHASGYITTVAGNGGTHFAGDNGLATSAQIYLPLSVTFDYAGNLYIFDANSVIRKVDLAGIITTIAGKPGQYSYSGDNGPAVSATFSNGDGVTAYGAGLYIADTNANRIREIALTAPATVNLGGAIVGSSNTGTVNFQSISGTAASHAMAYGNEFAVNQSSCTGGTGYGSCTVTFTPAYPGLRWDALEAKDGSGTVIGTELVYGTGEGSEAAVTPGTISTVSLGGLGSVSTGGMAFDPAGNLFVVDRVNNRVVKVDRTGNTSAVAIAGLTLNSPGGIAVDGAGNLDIADTGNSRIVQVAPNGTATAMTSSVGLLTPYGIAIARDGSLYVADSGNARIVRIPVNGASSVVSLSTALITPTGVAFDAAGNLYIADRGAAAVVALPVGGVSSVLASNLSLVTPVGVWTDAAGEVYVADAGRNQVLRMLGGVSTVVAGNGTAGETGDGGPATSAELTALTTVAAAPDGTMYVGDGQAVRKISTDAIVFGSTNAGATNQQNATVSNIGNAPYTFGRAFTLAAHPSQFTVMNSGSGDCSQFLNSSFGAGASCSLQVQFTPTGNGPVSDMLTLAAGLPISLTTVAGVTGPAVPNATTVNLLSEFTGGAGAPQTLTLTGSGVNGLNLLGATISGSNATDFFVTTSCGSTLAAGATCSYSIAFVPTVSGNESATLVVSYADAGSGASYTQNIALNGAGLSGVLTGIVEILSKNSGKALDVRNASTSNGAVLQQYDYLGLPNQRWQLVPVETGYYKIMNVNSGMVLDVTGYSTQNGATIQQWTYLGGDNQKWSLTQSTDGSFQISNKLSGKVLDVTALSTADLAPIQQWASTGGANQKWQIVAAQQYFTITNKLSGKVLDVTGGSKAAGALLQQWDSLGGANQQWQFVALGNGYYELLNRNSGKALDAIDPFGVPTPNGTRIQQYDFYGLDNQQWKLIPTQSGYYEIANKSSGKALDVTGYSTLDGAGIQLWTYLSGSNQQWRIDAMH